MNQEDSKNRMLHEYQRKRDFAQTPEPRADRSRSSNQTKSSLRFVIQKHAARRLHYDFRLELDGFLLSWAVPKGLSLNPSQRRMAIRTEDHPLEYRNFEGIIPAPGYGAGEVIIWDQGRYYPIEDDKPLKGLQAQKALRQALKAGKITIFLEGKKLKGGWSLIRLKGKGKDWLLMKHNDSFANGALDENTFDQSVITECVLDEINKRTAKAGREDSSTSTQSTNRLRQREMPGFQPPMLATLADSTFSKQGWFFEPKLDGIRGLAYVHNGNVNLFSRRGLSINKQYPSLVKELVAYKEDFILDGEIVAFDQEGRPSFQDLQGRSGLTKTAEIKLAEAKTPIVYYIFDILYKDGKDLRTLPLKERKTILQDTISPSRQIRLVESLGEDGNSAFRACLNNGLEGVVGKNSTSEYESGRRSRSWLKVKGTSSEEFLICGYTEGTGSRKSTFGSLILGSRDRSANLKFVGGVGTGFDSNKLNQLMAMMKPLITNKCPFKICPQGISNPTWLKPTIIAEIKFAERTKDDILRTPVFLHLRKDISPDQIQSKPIVHVETQLKQNTKIKTSQSATVHELTPHRRMKKAAMQHSIILDTETILSSLNNDRENVQLELAGQSIELSNLNKVLWPAQKDHPPITKRDYISYLIQVSQYILPHLQNRLLTLIRFPNGINGQKFFQKHWEDNLPPFVQTVRAYIEHEDKDQNFLICNNLPTLIWLGQIADLELHTSHTRITAEPDAARIPKTFTESLERIENSLLNYPDYMVFDLDPYLYSGKEAKGEEPELHRKGFRKTCDVALWVKELLDKLSIKAFIKTSGKTGLHIYVPIVRNIPYDQIRQFSQSIGQTILQLHPDHVTMEWTVTKRTGKVFFDHNMNARSKSLASIYSPRVSNWATVSTAVDWHELNHIFPTDFTMNSLPSRLEELGDLWSNILASKNNLQELDPQPLKHQRF